MNDLWPVLAIIAVVLVLLWLAITLIMVTFTGAVLIFAWAAEQNFLGIAAYIALWVIAFPFMLIASLVVGLIAAFGQLSSETKTRKQTYRQQIGYDD